MIKIVQFRADVPANRELQITLPDDIPLGSAEVVVVVVSSEQSSARSLGDFARSEFFGMWHDRTDIIDTVDFARGLRAERWNR